MKSTGIVRKLDELGRIVIPIELRRSLKINEKDPLEIFIENDNIILTKYADTCIFCGSAKTVKTYRKKQICNSCLKRLKPSK